MGLLAMTIITTLWKCQRRKLAPLAPPSRVPFQLLLASLIFSVQTASFHPAVSMMASTSRRSARLQKRSLTLSSSSNANDPPVPDQYRSKKVSELRDLLRERGLAVSGVKSVLIERLTAATATDAPASANTNVATKDDPVDLQPRAKRVRKKSSVESIPQPTVRTKAQDVPPSVDCLPRTRELYLKSKEPGANLAVIGVDEAGRGPLAGPVVAAAAIVPTNIAGIIDSKKINKEEERERIYAELIASSEIRYAVAIVNAQRIDEINILQATLEGMRMAVEGVIGMGDAGDKCAKGKGKKNIASAERSSEDSYIITGGYASSSNNNDSNNDSDSNTKNTQNKGSYYALIDGNKTPKEMPCPCEAMTKGDGREYSIGAASILAKVTRDRLMHEYDAKYPEYNLSQHKGYPTAAHMSAVRKFGASPIHRRTFAPLKHMEFDEDGNIVG